MQGTATEKTGRGRKLKSSHQERWPGETLLTCANDLLGTEEGDFHCNNRSCIVLHPLQMYFLHFIPPRSSRFWPHVLTKCLPAHKLTCQYANVSLRSRMHAGRCFRCTQTQTNKSQNGNFNNASGRSFNSLNLLSVRKKQVKGQR